VKVLQGVGRFGKMLVNCCGDYFLLYSVYVQCYEAIFSIRDLPVKGGKPLLAVYFGGYSPKCLRHTATSKYSKIFYW
jgi:hypothetical protein